MSQLVSAVIITFNNDETIEKVLDSLLWADEIVIVDSGSKDKTLSICESRNCRIYHRNFDNYSAQKRYAVEQAKNNWILSVDGDEVLSDGLIEEIQNQLKDNPILFAGYKIPIGNYFYNRLIRHGGWFPDYHLRLFDKTRGGFNLYPVHESVEVNGNVKTLNNMIKHYCYRDITRYMEKINKYSTLTAEGIFKDQKRKFFLTYSLNLLLRPVFTFILRYFVKLGFLDGKEGLVLNLFHSYYVFSKYAKLWELEYRDSRRLK